MLGKIITSLIRIIRRFQFYMLPAMLSVSTTFVMIGFIFLSDQRYDSDRTLVTGLIVFGLLMMMACIFLIRTEEHKNKTREQALLINLIAIGQKLGVGLNELMQARAMLDMIDKTAKGNKNQSDKAKGDL